MHRRQAASVPRSARIAAHRFNLLRCHFPLERTETTQAESVFPGDDTDLFTAFSRQMLAQGVIFEAAFEGQGNCFRHAGIRLPGRETEVKMEINGAWNID